MSFLLIWAGRALIDLLNRSVAVLGNPVHICLSYLQQNETDIIIVIKAFLIVVLTNFMHASTCPLLWWYKQVMAWYMFICLQIV